MNSVTMYVDKPYPITIGYQGEYTVEQIVFDYSAWIEPYGEGTLALHMARPTERSSPYPVVLEDNGDNTATWTISETDCEIMGAGEAQLVYTLTDGRKKSCIFLVTIERSLATASNAPDPYESWLDTLTDLGTTVQQYASDAEDSAEAAETAVTHYPYISDGHWYVWDATNEAWVNTNVSATGTQGEQGETGADGTGISSIALNADYTLTITLTDGMSYTTTSIRGAQGATGEQGATGATGATGAQGATGNGIASTVLNSDYTLTITFTDGTTYTTPSIRGATGETGATGATGSAGADGMSAYEAAVEGGYTDTEANFYADLAAIEDLASELASI